jgi:hypothetical protein
MLQKINWNQFRLKNENYRQSFEDLCYYLFCRQFRIREGIRVRYNQKGLETEPVKDKNGALLGFQAKFFDNKLSDDSSVQQIIKSIKNAKEEYKGLSKIIIYSHQSLGRGRPSYQTSIENAARPIAIEWFLESNFKAALTQPSNLDLAQLYFGVGDEIGFIKNSVNKDILTFIQSTECLELPLLDKSEAILSNITPEFFKTSHKEFILTGNPGSGKSMLIHRILQELAGLNQSSKREMLKIIKANKAVPMLVNLKDCAVDSLESILRNRKEDYDLRKNKSLGFIYLFDGLDELADVAADNVLTQIVGLSKSEQTKKIIISCRSGSPNKLKAYSYFNDVIEYRITELDQSHIDKYFQSKADRRKLQRLNKFKNTTFINDIKDVLLISFLWDTIDDLNSASSIMDLYSKKIDLLLNDHNHKKYIDDLNLLDPKHKEILSLNQIISFEFQKQFQFRFAHRNLQDLVLNYYPRLDYKSVNLIIDYISSMFFDNSGPNEPHGLTYAYQHRSYQDYFFTQILKQKFEEKPTVLRDLQILPNREYFEGLFLKYVRGKYDKQNNIVGLIGLNLIDVYLGRNKLWGSDNSYFRDSEVFMPALAVQSDVVFNELVNSESDINIGNTIPISEIKKAFTAFNNNKDNNDSYEYLKNIWEGYVDSLITSIATLLKYNKHNVATKLEKELNNILSLYEKNSFSSKIKEHDRLQDPFWEQWEDWIYIILSNKGCDVKTAFEKLIRGNYGSISTARNYISEESNWEKLVKSFYRVCLRERFDDFLKLLADFSENEYVALLDVLRSIQYLPLFIQNKSLSDKINTFVMNYSKPISEFNYFVLFYKKFFGIYPSVTERQLIQDLDNKLRDEREFDWSRHNVHLKIALYSYILSEDSFKTLLIKNELGLYYRNELLLYSALFQEYIDILSAKKNLGPVVRDYVQYISTHSVYSRSYLKNELSVILAHIIKFSEWDEPSTFYVRKIVELDDNNIDTLKLYLALGELNFDKLHLIVNEQDIKQYEDDLMKWTGDYPSYVDRCFYLSLLFSKLNPNKSKYYIIQGVNIGVLRHGWRKDYLVSYLLVDALEILWRNNWATRKVLSRYANEVFDLTVKVTQITDGKETWSGPYNVVSLVARSDIALAETFKNKIINEEGRYNVSSLLITSILKAKIDLGFSIEDIEREMQEYRKEYDYEKKPRAEYFEEKFKVYLKIATNDLYTDEERLYGFNKAYEQVDEIISNKINYYLRDGEFVKEKNIFKALCDKYGQECKIPPEENNNETYGLHGKKKIITEEHFIRELRATKTKRKLNLLYKKLRDYDYRVELTQYKSWKLLIDKTLEIMGNVKRFIMFLEDNAYPHLCNLTQNSKHLHYGLAVALANIATKKEIMTYLSDGTGHGGFFNVMKAYEVNRDKEMCIRLFDHYLAMCKLLVL